MRRRKSFHPPPMETTEKVSSSDDHHAFVQAGERRVPSPGCATPPHHVLPQRPPKRSKSDKRTRRHAAHNEPVVVSDMTAAVQRIQHLRMRIKEVDDENRLLRNAAKAAKVSSETQD